MLWAGMIERSLNLYVINAVNINFNSQRLGGKIRIAFVCIALRINEFLSLQ